MKLTLVEDCRAVVRLALSRSQSGLFVSSLVRRGARRAFPESSSALPACHRTCTNRTNVRRQLHASGWNVCNNLRQWLESE